jgi:hypothetical protein
MTAICKVCETEKPIRARGLCVYCYSRATATGTIHKHMKIDDDPSDPLPDDYRIDRAKAKARQFYTVKADSRRVGEVMTLETRGGNQ